MSKRLKLWKSEPSAHDFNAASRYLSLIFPPAHSKKLVLVLRNTSVSEHAAKDLLRASSLPLLSRDETHVEAELKRINKGKRLSPVLLVRGDVLNGVPLVIADGYHRVCASCYYDEDAPIACCIVSA